MGVTKLKARPKTIRAVDGKPLRIRIGVGTEEGFIKIGDADWDNPDVKVDLKWFPWPIESASVDTIYSAFYFHRLNQYERFAFMNECGRILKVGAQLIMQMPHGNSMRVAGDPWAQWPPIMENSFFWYNKAWRDREHAEDLGLECDFTDVYGYGHTVDPDLTGRSDEYIAFAKKHYNNAILDLHVTLTKQS